MSGDDDQYNAVGAWFLGPKGENQARVTELFNLALKHHVDARQAYYPKDDSPITAEMQSSAVFQENSQKLETLVNTIAPQLAKSSVPFWNPRYNGHMLMDTSMAGTVGYFTGMLSNPNNVALEASPLSTILEKQVGLQLCNLVGINTDTNNTKAPMGWGHITCDGSVANLESMWAARNLKFYPFSLKSAMDKELSFLADTFKVPTCSQDAIDSTTPLFKDLTTWDLLNLTPSTILDIATRLTTEYSVTPSFLERALKPYSIQTVGKDHIEKQFGIKPMAYCASTTMHYSWPKGAAITGIGSENVLNINVDNSARMDVTHLEQVLQDCLKQKRAVYTVVAIIGSTEHGACDPLKDIQDVRDKFRKEGLSFALHADGAWGTYFTAAVPADLHQLMEKLARKSHRTILTSGQYYQKVFDTFVPTLPLKLKTVESLVHLKYCDSITVDPHKSGYVQYPAGGLLYRDERMRYLVTWTSPVVYRNEPESMGVYGVEGSKPGAAAVAAFFSHSLIPLNPKGYGQLLGEAMFSCVKMYAHLSTMSTDKTDFIVRPMNLLPAEEEEGGKVEEQKRFIRKYILNVPNRVLVRRGKGKLDNEDSDDVYDNDDEYDDQDREQREKGIKAWELVVNMGSDLSINAFAVNFRMPDGTINKDVVEANYLGRQIFNQLSMSSDKQDITTIPLILTSTQFPQKTYGKCLDTFKGRLGLEGPQDLYILINCVMSPWPTADNLTKKVIKDLKAVIEKNVKVSQFRNTLTPDYHAFIMQGTDTLYLVHLAMFYMENHRLQLVITGDLPSEVMTQYVAARDENPKDWFALATANDETLVNILEKKQFDASILQGTPLGTVWPLSTGFKLTNIQVIVQRDLHTNKLLPYPATSMPFALYGTENQRHIDHIYTSAPNIQLSAEQVKVEGLADSEKFAYAHLKRPDMESFDLMNSQLTRIPEGFFFRSGAVFRNVTFTKDIEGKDVIGTAETGTITLGDKVYIDTMDLNIDPEPKIDGVGAVTGVAGPHERIKNGMMQATAAVPQRHRMQGHLDFVNDIRRGLGQ